MTGKRFGRRSRGRWLHAFSWGGVLVANSLIFVVVLGPDSSTGKLVSLTTAYTSLIALLFTLTIGPLNVLLDRRNPLSTDLRRDAGLASAALAVAHTAISLTNHFGGDVMSYFFSPRDVAITSIRHDAFGVGAWTGIIAIAVMVTLAMISSDKALRRLGRRRWKRIQRINYPLAALTTVHLAAFWFATDRVMGVIIITAVLIVVVVALQSGGAMRRMRAEISS